jgi:hypothetical protein
VAEATAWLPGHQDLELKTLSIQPATANSERRAACTQSPLTATAEQLMAEADIMMRGYRVRSGVPVFGPLIAWLRRNLTSHLREPYVDPTFERQVTFNRHTALALKQLIEPVTQSIKAADSTFKGAAAMQQDLEARMVRVEAWLSLIAGQLSLISMQGQPQSLDPRIDTLRKQIEMVRMQLEAHNEAECGDEQHEDPAI